MDDLLRELLTTQEVAQITRLSENTLKVLRSLGRSPIPYVKQGRRVFYRTTDVQAYLRNLKSV